MNPADPKERPGIELVDEDTLELSETDLSWPDELPAVGMPTPTPGLPEERDGEPGSSFPEPQDSPLPEQDWAERTAGTDIDAFDDDGLLEPDPSAMPRGVSPE